MGDLTNAKAPEAMRTNFLYYYTYNIEPALRIDRKLCTFFFMVYVLRTENSSLRCSYSLQDIYICWKTLTIRYFRHYFNNKNLQHLRTLHNTRSIVHGDNKHTQNWLCDATCFKTPRRFETSKMQKSLFLKLNHYIFME